MSVLYKCTISEYVFFIKFSSSLSCLQRNKAFRKKKILTLSCHDLCMKALKTATYDHK